MMPATPGGRVDSCVDVPTVTIAGDEITLPPPIIAYPPDHEHDPRTLRVPFDVKPVESTSSQINVLKRSRLCSDNFRQ